MSLAPVVVYLRFGHRFDHRGVSISQIMMMIECKLNPILQLRPLLPDHLVENDLPTLPSMTTVTMALRRCVCKHKIAILEKIH